jgi:hypothetical protein
MRLQYVTTFLLLKTLLFGCVVFDEVDSTNSIFKRDLKVYVKNQKVNIYGTGTVDTSRRRPFKLEIKAKNTKYIRITSCHRDIELKGIDKSYWTYTYNPFNGIEDQGSCPVDIEVYFDDGTFSLAYLDFNYDRATLVAQSTCNGEFVEFTGSSVCQTKFALRQRLKFSTEVDVYNKPECPTPVSADKKTFYISPKIDKCIYLFSSDTEDFIYTTLGYTEVRP